MAVEIIGKSEDVRRYREYLHNQGVTTKRFMDALKQTGRPLVKKPEGFRIFNGGIDDVYSMKTVNGVARVEKKLDPLDKLYMKGVANANIIDRMDERLEPAGLDIENFMKNRVLLLDHLYVASATIGRVISLSPESDGVHFEAFVGDPSKAELTQPQKDARSLIAQRLLQTVSVGFIPHKVQAPEFGDDGRLIEPAVILEWELLELSVVAVPANAGSVFEVGNLGASLNEKKRTVTGRLTSKQTPDTIKPETDGVRAEKLSVEDERVMEEKLLELLEEMKRIGTLMSSVSDSMKTIVDQNEGIIGRLDGDSREEEDEELDDEDLEDQEDQEDQEEEDEAGLDEDEDEEDEAGLDEDEDEDEDEEKSLEISELKNTIAKQNEKIEELSGIMLHILENQNGGKSNG